MQPHPHEPLRLAGRTAAPVRPAAAAADESVQLTGTGGPRVPQAVLTARSEEPVLSGGSQAANAAVAALPPAAAPVQLAEAKIIAAQPAQEPQPAPAKEEPADPASANLASWNSGAAAAPVQSQPAQTQIAPRQAAARPGFADVVAAVTALPTETPVAAPAPARSSAQRTPRAASQNAASTRTAAAASRPATERAAPAHPSRIWVQLGMSPNRSAFGYEISRMRKAAPELFKDRAPHVAQSGGGSHRLLVGPFTDAAAARTFINGLKQKDIESIPWTSPAGTEVERFAAGR
jgi:hypothetical protein